MTTFNPTKIIATLGPGSASEDTLRDMMIAGMDMARLNFSHGDHDDHAATFARCRRVAEEVGCHVGIIADLQGPKIRTGELVGGGPVTLKPGAELVITTEPCVGTAERVGTTYAGLPHDVTPGARLLLDDGRMELRVRAKTKTDVTCEVVVGGSLAEHKGINLPGVAVSAPSCTEKDRRDLQFALDLGVDYVALSFVRSPADVVELRGLCRRDGEAIPIIAKLEKPEALAHLAEVVAAADAVMVARGDLAVELSPEEVPVWQKRIIAECAAQSKPVITATQMLESMRDNPQPTRAEASDVANAIFDGSDAVMLSAETAVGQYPVAAVTMMRRIAASAEREQQRWQRREPGCHPVHEMTIAEAISAAAVEVAAAVDARAVIAFTESGSTARMASKRRPGVPILACTPLAPTARRCSLYWGVQPVIVPTVSDAEEMIARTGQELKRLQLLSSDDRVVFAAGVPMGQPGSTNTLSVEIVE